MSNSMEERVLAMAASQHGVITRTQVLDAGMSPSAVGRRLRQGRFRPVHRGVYLVGPLVPPHARLMAAVLAGGSEAVLSHLSAASLWGLTMPSGAAKRRGTVPVPGAAGTPWVPDRPDAEPVDLTVEAGNRGRRPGIRVHRVARLDREERTVRHGIPVTTPGRTLVDLASTGDGRLLERAIARAERERLVDREAVSRLIQRHRRRPGIALLRSVVEAPGGAALTRSEAEGRFLTLAREAGLPSPKANAGVGPYEVDFLWKAEGVAVEVDGFEYHASRPQFEADRRKDAWLLARGIQVIRLSWRQIAHEPMATIVQVAQGLARSRP